MEEQNAQETQPDASQNPPPPPPIVTDEPVTSPDEQPGNSHNTGERQAVEQEPVKIIIQEDNRSNADAIRANEIAGDANNITTRANRIANRANLVSFFSLVLAGAVFYITYLLFKETQTANETTKQALRHQVEKDSFDAIAKARQDTIDKEQRKKDDSTHKIEGLRDSARFELERTSTQAQIEAFRDQGKRFELENTPDLSLGEKSFYSPTDNKIYYEVDNNSNYAIKIKKLFVRGMYVETEPVLQKDINHIIDTISSNASFSAYISPKNLIYFSVPVTDVDKSKFKNPIRLLVLKVVFENPLNKKPRYFKTIIGTPDGNVPISLIYSDNTNSP